MLLLQLWSTPLLLQMPLLQLSSIPQWRLILVHFHLDSNCIILLDRLNRKRLGVDFATFLRQADFATFLRRFCDNRPILVPILRRFCDTSQKGNQRSKSSRGESLILSDAILSTQNILHLKSFVQCFPTCIYSILFNVIYYFTNFLK